MVGLLPALVLLALALSPPQAVRGQSADPAAQRTGEALDCPRDRELCVQAERTGGIDLKTGIARLEGNVRGVVRSRALSFGGQSLTAFRNGGDEWVRLVLEQDVQVRQLGREASSDHGVVERQEVRLSGHVRILQEELRIDGHEAVIEEPINRTTVRGTPEVPVAMELRRALLAAPADPAPAPEALAAPPAEVTVTYLNAENVVVDGDVQRVVLTGGVRVEQSDDRLRINARQVTLLFAPDRTLESFRAEGDVVIQQPERKISADFAQSRNQLETILLVGHARMQQTGQFDLASDRIELYTDANKGILQSAEGQKPITLSLSVADKQSYGLTEGSLLTLSQRGLPLETLEKLAPLVGRTYPSRSKFRTAASGLLTGVEAKQHMDTILSAAPLGAR